MVDYEEKEKAYEFFDNEKSKKGWYKAKRFILGTTTFMAALSFLGVLFDTNILKENHYKNESAVISYEKASRTNKNIELEIKNIKKSQETKYFNDTIKELMGDKYREEITKLSELEIISRSIEKDMEILKETEGYKLYAKAEDENNKRTKRKKQILGIASAAMILSGAGWFLNNNVWDKKLGNYYKYRDEWSRNNQANIT